MKKIVLLLVVVLLANLPYNSKAEAKQLERALVVFKLIDENTGQNIQASLRVDGRQIHSSELYNFKVADYTVESDEVVFLDNEITVGDMINTIELKVRPKAYIKNYEIVNQRYISQVVIVDVVELLQKPDLPNGCEITSLTILMQSMGFDVGKLELESYLDKTAFKTVSGVKYGGDPEVSFAGDPKKNTGWYVFEGPVIKAGNDFLDEGSAFEVVKVDDLIQTLNKGQAMAVWTTLDMSPIRYGSGWYLEDGRKINAIRNLHCIVVYGYDLEYYYIVDPLIGKIKLRRTKVDKSYNEMGGRAITIISKK